MLKNISIVYRMLTHEYPMQLHFRSGKLVSDLFIWSKQITKCNLVFNDELFHLHAY